MSEEQLHLVVDASVGIKLFVDEPFSDAAHALFAKLSIDPPAKLFVPDLFYIECTNILLKYIHRFGRSHENSRADLDDLKLLAITSIPTEDLAVEALTLAADRNLTAYDACYAVLAKRLEIPLVTADEVIAKAIKWAIRLEDLNL
jgi:predicted nucleic acid-binding protein